MGLLAVLILDEGDVGGAVGVVLQAEDLSRALLLALEVDDTILALVSAAAVADGDAAVAVAAGILLNDLGQAALGLGLLIDALERGHRPVAAGRSRGLISVNRHSSLPSLHPVSYTPLALVLGLLII